MGYMTRSIHCTPVGAAGAAVADVSIGVESCRLMGYAVNYTSTAAAGTSVRIDMVSPAGTKPILAPTVGNTDLPLRSFGEAFVDSSRVDRTLYSYPVIVGDIRVQVSSANPETDSVVVTVVLEV